MQNKTGCIRVKVCGPVLISLGYYDKVPLNTTNICSLTFPELRTLKSRCQRGHGLSERNMEGSYLTFCRFSCLLVNIGTPISASIFFYLYVLPISLCCCLPSSLNLCLCPCPNFIFYKDSNLGLGPTLRTSS